MLTDPKPDEHYQQYEEMTRLINTKSAIEAEVRAESQEPVAWRNMHSPNGIKRFMTHTQYDANPKLQQYYEPFKCASCDAPQPQGCTRSHPHENMSAECEAKTVEARRVFWEAQSPIYQLRDDSIGSFTDVEKDVFEESKLPVDDKRIVYTAPQQPAPCHLPLEKSHYCPDCEALQAKVAELNELVETVRNNNNALHHARDLLRSEVTKQSAEIARLTKESSGYASNLQGKHATTGATYQHMQTTIAQQAERIAELEQRVHEISLAWQVQFALIEQCEKVQVRALAKLAAYVGVCNGDKELTGLVLPLLRESLAAIAAHKKGIQCT